jgi:outer membrane protein with beta-barrel domain
VRIKLLCWLLVPLFADVPAFAEDSDDLGIERPAAPLELAAFTGFRGGGTFDIADSDENADVSEHLAFSAALDYHLDDTSSLSLFFSRSPTWVSVGAERTPFVIRYFMLGGTLMIEEMSYVHPYVTGLIGVGRFSVSDPEAKDLSELAVSFGVGVRVPLAEHFDLRLEGRGYVTFVDSQSSLFCEGASTENVCRLRGNGSTFVQFEVLAGFAWSF